MTYTFSTSRLSKGNTVFPITVVIDKDHLYYSKGFIIGQAKTAIPKTNIVSIGLVKGVLFSDLIIETKGGRVVCLNGFSHSDAKSIYNLLNK